MVCLYEPDGTQGECVSVAYAIEWCKTHIGWTWGYSDCCG